jgi:hypothetical protein
VKRVVLLLLAASSGYSHLAAPQAAQLDPSKREAFHQHVVALLQSRGRPLPPGDTAVSWTDRGPILYFTSRFANDTATSAMAREDGLVGTALAVWSQLLQTGFHSVWTRGDSVVLDVTGLVEGTRLVLHGTRDTTFALPSIPWLVADYGLEDQQLPLFRALALKGGSVAIYRPYVMKWDTVTISGHQAQALLIVSAQQGPKVKEIYLIDREGRLLLLRRLDITMDRRPLEGTPLYERYTDALPVLESSKP